MARYAIIADNVIQNLVDWDGGPQWAPPPGTAAALAPMRCGIGWTWNNGAPVDPNPPPQPPVFVPPDLANIDNLDRAFRAMGLLLRDYTNALQAGTHSTKTIAQFKADFATKYNALP
jgi:hypothetical protein